MELHEKINSLRALQSIYEADAVRLKEQYITLLDNRAVSFDLIVKRGYTDDTSLCGVSISPVFLSSSCRSRDALLTALDILYTEIRAQVVRLQITISELSAGLVEPDTNIENQ
jgi:hypothetical protein